MGGGALGGLAKQHVSPGAAQQVRWVGELREHNGCYENQQAVPLPASACGMAYFAARISRS